MSKNKKQQVYDDASIELLAPEDRVRLRPSNLLGTDDIRGAFHTVIEILGNSLDEVRAGFGSSIEVIYHKDNSITIKDFGRGVPLGMNPKVGRYNWDLIYNELYAGGKYSSDSDLYKYPIGMNGVGGACSQYTSEWFKVISKREDAVRVMNFEKGKPVGEMTEEPNTTGETGTEVSWKPDDEVFYGTDFTSKMFEDLCESQAHINGVTIVYKDEHTNAVREYKGVNLNYYLKELVSPKGDINLEVFENEEEIFGTDEKGKKYKAKCEICLAITEEDIKSKRKHFHNTSAVSVGVHFSAFDDAITTFFKKIGKDNGVVIKPYDYNDYINCIVSTYSTITSFAGQTKNGVSNSFIYTLIYDNILKLLQEAQAKGKKSITTLIDNVVNVALARKKAKEIEAQERAIKKSIKKSARPKIDSDKYTDCDSTNPEERELFLVEGDSAAGACKQGRDPYFQAVLALKGKPINCLKDDDVERILTSDVFRLLMQALGVGLDIKGADIFDISKIKFNKILITTDGDIDGFQIRVLLYTFFYRYMPRLLDEGYVYLVESPLYEIVDKNGNSRFAFSVKEKDEVVEEMQRTVGVYSVNRSKGLGENNEDMMWDTTMNPETRHLVQLKIDVKNQIVRELTNVLFGKDVDNERKELIFGLLEDLGLSDVVDIVGALDIDDIQNVDEAI